MKISIKGTVFAYSEDVASGLIRCSEGRKYRFQKSEWLAEIPPSKDMLVHFTAEGIKALRVQAA